MDQHFPKPLHLPPGNVISVETHLFWRHRGIVSDRWHNGRPTVISASARAGCVCEEPWEVFTAGKQAVDEGYPSVLPTWEVLQRARQLIGTPYRILEFNCDHFATLAHGAEPQSTQLGATIAVALMAVLIRTATAR